METSSMKLSTHCCCASLKVTEVWRSLAIDYRQFATSAHCALQHALTPLCYFTWPTTLWRSFCSQLLPLCYNTTNS
ncbi:unnamed protein product [Staurois parvus]|uniref:Uncharacterized protein n=1 Tax=Staurois parvus TaxID=386267 RepID=A0ABN9HDZ9_9NEOB|nr:unnamed protein product [Staurois parvus]